MIRTFRGCHVLCQRVVSKPLETLLATFESQKGLGWGALRLFPSVMHVQAIIGGDRLSTEYITLTEV